MCPLGQLDNMWKIVECSNNNFLTDSNTRANVNSYAIYLCSLPICGQSKEIKKYKNIVGKGKISYFVRTVKKIDLHGSLYVKSEWRWNCLFWYKFIKLVQFYVREYTCIAANKTCWHKIEICDLGCGWRIFGDMVSQNREYWCRSFYKGLVQGQVTELMKQSVAYWMIWFICHTTVFGIQLEIYNKVQQRFGELHETKNNSNKPRTIHW